MIVGSAEVQPMNGPRSPEAGRSRPTSAPRLRSGGFLFLQNSGLSDRRLTGRGSRKRNGFGLHRRCRGRETKSEKNLFFGPADGRPDPDQIQHIPHPKKGLKAWRKGYRFDTLKKGTVGLHQLHTFHTPKKGIGAPRTAPNERKGGTGRDGGERVRTPLLWGHRQKPAGRRSALQGH